MNGDGLTKTAAEENLIADGEARKINHLQVAFRQPSTDIANGVDGLSDDETVESNSCVVIHHSMGKTIWDWVILAFTTYTVVVVPFVVTFPVPTRSLAKLTIDAVVDLFFVVDIVVNFHTTYNGSEGRLVTNLKKIRIKYAKSWLTIDALACFPHDLVSLAIGEVVEQRFAQLLGALKAFRLLRIIRIARNADRYLEHVWATLFMLMSLILLICHWMACGWFAVSLQGVSKYLAAQAQMTTKTGTVTNAISQWDVLDDCDYLSQIHSSSSVMQSIIDEYDLRESLSPNQTSVGQEINVLPPNDHERLPPTNWLLRLAESSENFYAWNQTTQTLTGGPDLISCYVASLYFTMTAVQSSGYGNIAADTIEEKIYCIFILLFGALLYAAIIGNVSTIIEQLGTRTREFLGHMKTICDFAELHKLPRHLKESMCDYVNYTWVVTHGIAVNEILGHLTEHMRTEVRAHLHRQVLQNQKVFKNMSGLDLVTMARILRRSYAAPGDMICDKGEKIDFIIFVISGSLEVTYDSNIAAILSKGDSFGMELPSRINDRGEKQRSVATVKALTYANLDVIKISDLVSLLNLFPHMESTFRSHLNLTYNLRKNFVYRTMEAVRLENEASKNLDVRKKQQIMKKWLQQTRKKTKPRKPDHQYPDKELSILRRSPGNAVYHLAENRTKMQPPLNRESKSSSRSRSAVNAAAVTYQPLDRRSSPENRAEESLKRSKTAERVAASTDSRHLSLWTKFNQKCKVVLDVIRTALQFVSGVPGNKVSPADETETGKGDDVNVAAKGNISRKRLKKDLSSLSRNHPGNEKIRKKFKCCERCGKPVGKKSLGFAGECKLSRNKNVELSTHDATNESAAIQAQQYYVAKEHDKISYGPNSRDRFAIANTKVRATVNEVVVGSDGKKASGTRDVTFMLESEEWADMGLPEETKDSLRCMLNYKQTVAKQLSLFHDKLVQVENLINTILQVVDDDSFSLIDLIEDG